MILDKLTLVWRFGFMLVKILSIGLAALKMLLTSKEVRSEQRIFISLHFPRCNLNRWYTCGRTEGLPFNCKCDDGEDRWVREGLGGDHLRVADDLAEDPRVLAPQEVELKGHSCKKEEKKRIKPQIQLQLKRPLPNCLTFVTGIVKGCIQPQYN